MTCIFACDGVTCSTKNLVSLNDVICMKHLKEVFGIKVWMFQSESPQSTDQVGPYFTPDDHLTFPPNCVVIPHKNYLDGILMPDKYANNFENYTYHLNPRLRTYYDNLIMNRMEFSNTKTSKYHFELIRNLGEKDHKDIKLINELDMAGMDLKKHLQNRIMTMNHWIENEPYYSNFQKMQIIPLNEPDKVITADTFSPFIGFMLYNTVFEKTYLPVPNQEKTSPLMAYANLAYKKNVGWVTLNEVRNNVQLVVMGNLYANYGYYQQKTHSEPKQVVVNRMTFNKFPDTMRNLNVISSNDEFKSCRGRI